MPRARQSAVRPRRAVDADAAPGSGPCSGNRPRAGVTGSVVRADELARALGGKKAGRQWQCRCPAHADSDPSLIVFDGRAAVQVRCLAGCQPGDVIAACRRLGVWQDDEADERAAREKRQRALDEKRARAEAELRARALEIWDEARPAAGTVVETVYLRWWRGVDVPPALRAHLLTDVLRFHPRCPRRNGRAPAMVALMRSVHGDRPVAVHRTFLDAQWRKAGAPMMLGTAAGAAVKLTPHDATFADEFAYCPRLNIAEGIETGLTQLARGHAPLWALGSAGAIERFPVLFAVGALCVWGDLDWPTSRGWGEFENAGPGERAAAICIARWQAAGKQASGLMPRPPAAEFEARDFNDGVRVA